MTNPRKPAGLPTCLIVWTFCAALLAWSGIVVSTWWALLKSLPHGLSASFPRPLDLYFLLVLVLLSGLKVYVWVLARDARRYAFQLCVEPFGVS